MPPFEQILGPLGALVLAIAGIVALAKDHRDSDTRRRIDYEDTITYEREARKAAEARLDTLRETMKASTDVTERAVSVAERLLDERRA